MHSQRTSRAGFTLIELLAVMAIVGVLMTMSIVAFHKIGSGTALRSSTMMFKSGVSLARQTAITKRSPTTLIYGNLGNPPRAFYMITNELEGIVGYTNWLSDGIVFYEDTEQVMVYGSPHAAYFEPLYFEVDGSMDNGAINQYIGLRENKLSGDTNVLNSVMRLEPLTGRISEYVR